MNSTFIFEHIIKKEFWYLSDAHSGAVFACTYPFTKQFNPWETVILKDGQWNKLLNDTGAYTIMTD